MKHFLPHLPQQCPWWVNIWSASPSQSGFLLKVSSDCLSYSVRRRQTRTVVRRWRRWRWSFAHSNAANVVSIENFEKTRTISNQHFKHRRSRNMPGRKLVLMSLWLGAEADRGDAARRNFRCKILPWLGPRNACWQSRRSVPKRSEISANQD